MAAPDAPQPIVAAYRALRGYARACEALYPLAPHLRSVSHFFLEQAARTDPELASRLAAADPTRDGVGFMHIAGPAGTRGAFTLERMVDAWIREKRYFTPGLFPNNSATGNVDDIGHYTQLMWRDTGEVGCALARGSAEDVLVCRYSDAGNYIGERPF